MRGTLSLGPYDALLRQPLLVEMGLEGGIVNHASITYPEGDRAVELSFGGASPQEAVTLAERICARSSVAHATAFCMAVEDACGIEVDRAREALRLVLAECERIASHLEVLSDVGLALGDEIVYRSPRRYLPEMRGALTALCGSPLGFGALSPGGTKARGDRKALEALATVLGPLRRDGRSWERRLSVSRARLAGHAGAPELTGEETLSAPALRAAGLRRDMRSGETAYGLYAELPCRAAFAEGGGALDRVRVLTAEILSSADLIDKASGSVETDDPGSTEPRLRQGSGMGAVEGPEGSVIHKVYLGSGGRIIKVRIGTAAGVTARMAAGSLSRNRYEDAAAVLASFPLCAACLQLKAARPAAVSDEVVG